jgi:hypothetical protein
LHQEWEWAAHNYSFVHGMVRLEKEVSSRTHPTGARDTRECELPAIAVARRITLSVLSANLGVGFIVGVSSRDLQALGSARSIHGWKGSRPVR